MIIKHEEYLMTRPLDNKYLKDMYVNDLTRCLNDLYIRKLAIGETYIMELKRESDSIVYAIRGQGRTNGNVIVNNDGYITSIILDEDVYKKEAFDVIDNYIRMKMKFVK